MTLLRLLLAALLALPLLACAQTAGSGRSGSQTVGTIGGAVLGGLAGSRFGGGTGQLASAAAGTLLGAYLGSQLGKRLDDRDQTAALQAEQRALASNEPTTWSNPQSDHRGTVQPVRSYARDGRQCRDYVHTVYIDGRAEDVRGTACQRDDGTWEVVG